MAINFSAASFAACLAGLKVPRQIMYCIAQDTNAPYVLYKDGMETSGTQSTQTNHHDVSFLPPPPQQQQQQTQQPPVAAPIQNEGVSSTSSSPTCGVEPPAQTHTSTMTSPVPSPFVSSTGTDDESPAEGGQVNCEQGVEHRVCFPGQQIQPPQSDNPVGNAYYRPGPMLTPSSFMHYLKQPGGGVMLMGEPLVESGYNGVLNDMRGSVRWLWKKKSVSSSSSSPTCGAEAPGQTHTSTMTSPVPSPFVSSTVAEEESPSDGQVGCESGLEHRVCFPGQHLQPSQTENNGGNSYYRPGPMPTPNSFMHYLKQPGGGVMLMGEPLIESSYNGVLNDMRCSDIFSGDKSKSGELRLFKCITCGKDFKQKSTLLQHERIHSDSRPYGCVDCGKRFRQQSHLTQHLRIHANEKPFACVYCERSFRQRAILNQHLRIHSGEKPFACPVCGKSFRQKAILNQHVRTHQDVSPHLIFKNGTSPTLWPHDVPFPEETPKEADYSNVDEPTADNTPYPAYFKDAKGIAHPACGVTKLPGMPLFVKCPICQKKEEPVPSVPTSLTRTHPKVNNFWCQKRKTKKEFKQKSTLLQHGCIHIESRPYPCGDCGKRFRQQSHLTQHLRIHTNEKPYACVYCGRHFRQRTILNQHLRIHTGEKPYRCIQCGKDFRQKAILDQHARTHQGERPYCCPLPNCRRRFSTEQDVKKHIENHMNPLAKQRLKSTPSLPVPYIKPELYFPPAFSQFAAAPPTTDFKPPVIEAQ